MGHYTEILGKIRMEEEHYLEMKEQSFGDIEYFFYCTEYRDGHVVWDNISLKNVWEDQYLNHVFHVICMDKTVEGKLLLVGEGFPQRPEIKTAYFAPSIGGSYNGRWSCGQSELKHFSNPF